MGRESLGARTSGLFRLAVAVSAVFVALLNLETATTFSSSAIDEASELLTTRLYANLSLAPDSDRLGSNSTGKKLWNSPVANIPPWMKDYFVWHHEQRLQLNSSNWSSKRFLIMRCLWVDRRCGGAADRLLSVPFAILVAAQSQRILLIKWERPAPLEFYIVPPSGGMDWRLPECMASELKLNPTPMMRRYPHAELALRHNFAVVDMRDQSPDHGLEYYNKQQKEGDPTYDEVFHHVWQILFEPSVNVQARLDNDMQTLGLVRNSYTAVHIRSTYSRSIDRSTNRRYLENAINCAARLAPEKHERIYIAADSVNASSIALDYAKFHARDAVVRRGNSSPLHIDRGTDYLSTSRNSRRDPVEHPPEAYLDTFTDLYLLAYSRCLAYTFGGYGRWANAISDNASCTIDHNAVDCSSPP